MPEIIVRLRYFSRIKNEISLEKVPKSYDFELQTVFQVFVSAAYTALI
jgi:hypothetical protein